MNPFTSVTSLRFVRPIGLLVAICLIQSAAGPATAQLPTTQLLAVYPPGGKSGTTVRVTIAGDNLDEVDRLVFSDPGISAKPIFAEPTPLEGKPQAIPKEYQVSIAADVTDGVYDVRAVGRYGVSNPRAFVIEQFDQTVAGIAAGSAANHSIAEAVRIDVGSVVNGRVAKNHADYYRFNAGKGDPLVISCAGIRIDSRIDATLVLYDSAGKELMQVRDTRSFDPVMAIRIPADGQYVLQVYDFMYRGGDDFFYRLTLSERPFVESIFPPAGIPGNSAEYTLYGYHLPNGQPLSAATGAASVLEKATVHIDLPADRQQRGQRPSARYIPSPRSMLDGHEHALTSLQGRSNSITIGYATAPVVIEKEPNDKAAQAQVVSIPCDFSGQFYPVGDRDWITFKATENERIWIDVVSNRAGRNTDPIVLVQELEIQEDGSEKVKQISDMDDVDFYVNRVPTYEVRSRDPALTFETRKNATYRVMIRDVHSMTRGDVRMTYRIIIGRGKPDFRLVAHSDPYRKSNSGTVNMAPIVLRNGGRASAHVHVFRRNGFDGDIHITVEDLPKGVTCNGAIVGGGANMAKLVFSVDEETPASAAPIRIVGRSVIEGKSVLREARPAALMFSTENCERVPPTSRLVQQMWLSVMDKESSPATLHLENDEMLETSLGGQLNLPVRVTRRDDFKSILELVPEGLPRQLRLDNLRVSGEEGKYDLRMKISNFPPGTYTFVLRGRGRFRYERNTDAIRAAEAEKEKYQQLCKSLTERIETFGADQATAPKARAEAGQDSAFVGTDEVEQPKQEQESEKDLQGRLVLAEKWKQKADEELKRVKLANAAEGTDFAVVSKPLRLRVHAAPISFDEVKLEHTVARSEKIEVPLKVQRRFGFDGPVTLAIKAPKGISAQKTVIEKGTTDGTLIIRADKSISTGQHQCQIQAKVRFSGLNLATDQTVTITVQPTNGPSTAITEK